MFVRRKTRMKALFRRQWGCDPRESAAAYMTRERLKYIRMYHDICGEKGVDEITWSDLEMDEVFFRINHTRSFVGEQVLYQRLHGPDSRNDLEIFEKLVSVFGDDEDGRSDYEYRLSGIGKTQADYYLPAMLEIISGHVGTDTRIYRCLQLLLAAAIIGTAVTQSSAFALCAVALACTNLIIYMILKSRQESMASCLKTLCVILRFCRFAEKNWPWEDKALLRNVREDLEKLKTAEQSAGSFAARKITASNDPRNLLADYVWGVTLINVLLRLFRFAGMIDAAISCASFRESLDCWCRQDCSLLSSGYSIYLSAGAPLQE